MKHLDVLMPGQELNTLERLARADWTAIHLVGHSQQVRPLEVRTSAAMIRGDRTWLVEVLPVDLAPRVEVFRLMVREGAAEDFRSDWPPPQLNEDAGEFLAAFVGRRRQILLGTRVHSAPDWRRLGIPSVWVDDVLVLKDSSGQRALLTPDPAQPGGLLISRALSHLEDQAVPVERLLVI